MGPEIRGMGLDSSFFIHDHSPWQSCEAPPWRLLVDDARLISPVKSTGRARVHDERLSMDIPGLLEGGDLSVSCFQGIYTTEEWVR
jgi:hypothetical protein